MGDSDLLLRDQVAERLVEGHAGSGHRRGGFPVGFDHVAVEKDGALAQAGQTTTPQGRPIKR
jgi:hypothetical protein